MSAPEKRYELNDVVTCFDEHGNHYRRKISVGLKRGEMYLARHRDGTGCAYVVAQPDGINLTNLDTGESVRHALNAGTRFVFPLSENAFYDAQCCPYRFKRRDCVEPRHDDGPCNCPPVGAA